MVQRPWSVQIELVEGCNRLCDFCGINGIRSKPGQDIKVMSYDIAAIIAKQCVDLNPTARYEFAMHGEPMLHPFVCNIIHMFRGVLPNAQFQMTTNGRMMLHDVSASVLALLDAGLDFIVVDTYEPERLRLQNALTMLDGTVDVYDFYDDCIPMKLSPWYNYHRKLNNSVIIMDDLGERSGEVKSRVIFNHAGNAFKDDNAPYDKVCTIPFRELSVCYDGDVCICCMDWGHEYVCGNASRTSLIDIWYGEEFEAARKILYQRKRTFSPCARCDHPSGSRAGLLPHYDPPTEEDIGIVSDIVEYSIPRNGFERILPESI